MSVGLAEPLPAVVCEEAIIDELFADYLWSDLKARRNALSLWPQDLATLLEIDLAWYVTFEYASARDVPWHLLNEAAAAAAFAARAAEGVEGVPPEYVNELAGMEAFVAEETRSLIDQAPAAGAVTIHALADQEEFSSAYPDARTIGHLHPYPVVLHYVAVGRAAAELRRNGRDVEVYRGDRRFDMAAARFAIGLGKKETAYLLGVNDKSYSNAERGAKLPLPRLMAELQRIEDFIAETASTLEVITEDGVSIVGVIEEQEDFENAYPDAVVERRTKTGPTDEVERTTEPYPVRMMWVAAGRRAGMLDAAGQPVRVAVLENA